MANESAGPEGDRIMGDVDGGFLLLSEGAPALEPRWTYAMDGVLIGPDSASFTRVSLVDRPSDRREDWNIPLGAESRAALHPLVRMYARLPVSAAPGAAVSDYWTGSVVGPTQAQLRWFVEEDHGTPIFMLNLLKYRSLARYLRYGGVALRHIARVGGAPVFAAPAKLPEWDDIAIVRYPSRSEFLEMVGSASYQRAESKHREPGLAKTRLYVLSALTN
jgi:hypothetical protein